MMEILCKKCGSKKFIVMTNSRHSESVSVFICENCGHPLELDENWFEISHRSNDKA